MKKLLAIFLTFFCLSVNAADFETKCIGSYVKGDCPAKVTVTLENESFMIATSLGSFFYCPSTGWTQNACVLNGTYNVINGELTIKQLPDHQAVFYKTKRIGYCYQFFGPYVCSPNN